ncbi:hypothetical protein V8E36_007830 [Tilletia maclaganii]
MIFTDYEPALLPQRPSSSAGLSSPSARLLSATADDAPARKRSCTVATDLEHDQAQDLISHRVSRRGTSTTSSSKARRARRHKGNHLQKDWIPTPPARSSSIASTTHGSIGHCSNHDDDDDDASHLDGDEDEAEVQRRLNAAIFAYKSQPLIYAPPRLASLPLESSDNFAQTSSSSNTTVALHHEPGSDVEDFISAHDSSFSSRRNSDDMLTSADTSVSPSLFAPATLHKADVEELDLASVPLTVVYAEPEQENSRTAADEAALAALEDMVNPDRAKSLTEARQRAQARRQRLVSLKPAAPISELSPLVSTAADEQSTASPSQGFLNAALSLAGLRKTDSPDSSATATPVIHKIAPSLSWSVASMLDSPPVGTPMDRSLSSFMGFPAPPSSSFDVASGTGTGTNRLPKVGHASFPPSNPASSSSLERSRWYAQACAEIFATDSGLHSLWMCHHDRGMTRSRRQIPQQQPQQEQTPTRVKPVDTKSPAVSRRVVSGHASRSSISASAASVPRLVLNAGTSTDQAVVLLEGGLQPTVMAATADRPQSPARSPLRPSRPRKAARKSTLNPLPTPPMEKIEPFGGGSRSGDGDGGAALSSSPDTEIATPDVSPPFGTIDLPGASLVRSPSKGLHDEVDDDEEEDDTKSEIVVRAFTPDGRGSGGAYSPTPRSASATPDLAAQIPSSPRNFSRPLSRTSQVRQLISLPLSLSPFNNKDSANNNTSRASSPQHHRLSKIRTLGRIGSPLAFQPEFPAPLSPIPISLDSGAEADEDEDEESTVNGHADPSTARMEMTTATSATAARAATPQGTSSSTTPTRKRVRDLLRVRPSSADGPDAPSSSVRHGAFADLALFGGGSSVASSPVSPAISSPTGSLRFSSPFGKAGRGVIGLGLGGSGSGGGGIGSMLRPSASRRHSQVLDVLVDDAAAAAGSAEALRNGGASSVAV